MVEKFKDLAPILLKKFFFNKDAYAVQLKDEDGKVVYNTTYRKIDANKLKFMLENNQAIMSYQQRFDKLKWICMDFDIKKKFVNEYYKFNEDNNYKPLLISEVKKAITYLEQKNIKHIVEFSGNRGVHIWIHLEEAISKAMGYEILSSIIEQIGFEYSMDVQSPIALDMYPKNGNSRGNKIGLGVKIPLSYHLKSNAYSYLLIDIDKIERIEQLDTEFIDFQIDMLNKIEFNKISYLLSTLNINKVKEFTEYEKVTGIIKETVTLDDIITMLSRSNIYKYIFSKEISELTEFDRAILTGTFIRISNEVNNNFGRDILYEYLSRDKLLFNEDVTREKLQLLNNLYPPSIAYLEKRYQMSCNYCKENGITNPLELLNNIKINSIEGTNNVLNWVIRSEKRYLNSNDEVPLGFMIDELDSLNPNELTVNINKVEIGKFDSPIFYRFERLEENKKRILYALSGKDRVLTTYVMYEINKVLYGEYSLNSYSYRLNSNLYEYEVFVNWNTLWMRYVKDIEDKLYSESYDNYYVMKLDIKDFYNQIDHTMLRDILYNKPSETTQLLIKNLDDLEHKKYINMCEYLISTSASFSNKGLPQGPAYARYLAELYLNSIDELIARFLNEDYEAYFRYVDDMVIIVENEERLNCLFDKIQHELGRISLELNNKVIKGKVNELRDQIITKDLEKYFIDGIDKSVPTQVLSRAVSILDKMLLNDISELNIKQVPFFMTHLIDKQYLNAKRDDIIQAVINNKLGRGSLFKHFYKNIIFSTEEIKVDFYMLIEGLSRSNFISQLSQNIEKLSVDNARTIIECYLGKSIEHYERIELLSIIVKSGVAINEGLLSDDDYNVIINLIKNVKYIKLNSKLLDKILIKIQMLKDKEEILRLLDRILAKSDQIENLENVVGTIFTTLSNHTTEVYVEHNKQLIFDLLAYITMYLDRYEKIVDVWQKFNGKYMDVSAKIHFNEWYKYNKNIIKSRIVNNSIVYFLTAVFKNDGVIAKAGPSEYEKQYAMFLFLYLFNIDNGFSDELRTKIQNVAKERNLEFLMWCLEGNVHYYPNDLIAIKNIQLNNRVVMKKDNQILVRGNTNIINDYNKFIIEDWFDNREYGYVTVNLDGELKNLDEKLSDMEYFQAILFLPKVIERANVNDKFINVFEKGSFIDRSNEIYFKYSKQDSKLVLNDDRVIDNNLNYFFIELLNCLTKSNIMKKSYMGGYEYSNKNFMNDFFPGLLTKTSEKISYFNTLCQYLHDNIEESGDNIYSIEISKLNAIGKFVKSLKELNYKKDFETIRYYNSLYNDNYEKFILYGKVFLQDSNLEALTNSIFESITENLEFNNFLIKALQNECTYIKENTMLEELSNFNKVEIDRIPNDNSRIMIAGKEFELNNLRYYEIGSSNNIKVLTAKELFILQNNKEYVYFYEKLIILIPSMISKLLEIIKYKKGQYDKSLLEVATSIANDPSFDNAVKNIMLQSDVAANEAKRRINDFLVDKPKKYHASLLALISAYRVIEQEEMDKFIYEIEKKISIKDRTVCILPLKKRSDNNGLHQILFNKYCDRFDRNSLNEIRINKDYEKINKEVNIDELVIISDVGLSGTQLRKAIDFYTGMSERGGKYFNLESDKFKKMLKNLKKVSLLNCLYTDKYEDEASRELLQIGYNGAIEFIGTKIEYKKFLFSELKMVDKENYIKYVKKYCSKINLKLPVPGNISLLEYVEDLCNDDTKNILLARYRSMPKYHNVILTNKTSIFRYRND